jgi:hypothetical protein
MNLSLAMMNIQHAPRILRDLDWLLQRIRTLIEMFKSFQRVVKEVALLKDSLLRLRLWEKDLAVRSDCFGQYEADSGNENMVQLLKDQIWKIDHKVMILRRWKNPGKMKCSGMFSPLLVPLYHPW